MSVTQSDLTEARDEHVTFTPRVGLWLAAVVAISLIVIVCAWHVVANRPDEDSLTVGSVIAGTKSSAEDDTDARAAKSPGYRLVELASALGLPNGVVPESAIEMGLNRDQARLYLMNLVNEAVSQGVLSPVEADGVIKAFEAGIVSAPVNITEEGNDVAGTDGSVE